MNESGGAQSPPLLTKKKERKREDKSPIIFAVLLPFHRFSE
jgi:hypothetical protein